MTRMGTNMRIVRNDQAIPATTWSICLGQASRMALMTSMSCSFSLQLSQSCCSSAATMPVQLDSTSAMAPKSCDAESGAAGGTEASGAESRINSADPTGVSGYTGHATGIIRMKNVGSNDGSSSDGVESCGDAWVPTAPQQRGSPPASAAVMPWTSPVGLMGRR